MQEIKQETQVTQAPELTYEEALKQFKAQWKDKRQEAKANERANAKAEKRQATADLCSKALELLKGIDAAFNKELAPVITRLTMFVNGDKYTRTKGGND